MNQLRATLRSERPSKLQWGILGIEFIGFMAIIIGAFNIWGFIAQLAIVTLGIFAFNLAGETKTPLGVKADGTY